MSERAAMQRYTVGLPSFTPIQRRVAARTCACGGASGHARTCETCRQQQVQRQATSASSLVTAPPIVQDALRSTGQPLDPATRAFMEPRFGHDFSQVRIHADAHAAQSARAINALAYTVGHDAAGTTATTATTTHTVDLSDLRVSTPMIERTGSESQDPHAMGGDTLPYREATELGECIRIMGEANSEYCRQEVLGEQPQPTPPPPPCVPTGLPRAQYLTQPGTSTGDFGLTTLSGTVTGPVVHTTRARGGVRLSPTHAALPPITSVFTAADTFTEGTAIFMSQGGDCPSGRYPIRWTIFPDGARKIREGELEHCADFQYAFAISLQRYADAVNALANSGRIFASQRAAEAHVTRVVGAAPANWLTIFECLARKTQLRDGARGYRGWHTPRPYSRPPRLETNCGFTHQLISSSSLPDVGQHPSSEIIRDCGETPGRSGGSGGRGR